MVSVVVNDVCRWAKERVVGLCFSFPTIYFEPGKSVKSLSADDLEDWKSKLTKAKEAFLVRRHPPVCDTVLNWFL